MNKTAFAKPLAALTILLSSGAVLTTSLAPEAEAGWDYLSHNHVKMNQWQLKSYYTQNPIIQNTELEDLSLIHISEPTRPPVASRMPSSA